MRSRYSMDKARRFLAYKATASRLRRAIVVSVFPLAGLLSALALALIPLRAPALGLRANGAFLCHVFCVAWITMSSAMVHASAVISVDPREYTLLAIAVVASIAAMLLVGFNVLLSISWRFPIPFSWAFVPIPHVIFIGVGHIIVFHRSRQLSSDTRTKLLQYVPSLSLRTSQVTIYPIYSVLFAAATESQQLVLVVFFPCIKYMLRRAIFAVSRPFGDIAPDIASCGVEICAAMHQASIMQTTPSPLITAAIIGMDVVINVVEIKWYLERKTSMPVAEMLSNAFAILTTKPINDLQDHELARFGTRRQSLVLSAMISNDPVIETCAKSSSTFYHCRHCVCSATNTQTPRFECTDHTVDGEEHNIDVNNNVNKESG